MAANTLPQIQLADTMPSWLVASVSGTDTELYRPSEMSAGARRMRRIYTTAPILRSMSLLLDEPQTREFERFFEVDLLAGTRMFAARVRDMGPGHVWYAAQFAEDTPVTYTPMIGWARNDNITWRVDCNLVLYGPPRRQGPIPTGLKGDARAQLVGRAVAASAVTLSSKMSAPLVGVAAAPWGFAGGVHAALVAEVAPVDGLPIYGHVAAPLRAQAIIAQSMTVSASISAALDGRAG